ncbi:MAG: SNF2-related protein [Mangrovibacterium sp.]
MANGFGKTWWGEKWLDSLSNIDYSNRLPRGASYARKGAVSKVKIDGNHIVAKVEGSRPRPYKVDLILPPFFEPELGNFIEEIIKRPTIISKLLNRELDPTIMDIAEKCGLKVFPKQWSDLKMQCSCPDWAVPCKHLASVIYKVSSEIDNDPFLAFSLHNVDLFEELSKRGIVLKKEAIEIPKLKNLLLEKCAAKKEYNPEDAYQKLSFAELNPIHEPLTALLTPNPAFYSASKKDFRESYSKHLNRVVKNTQKATKGAVSLATFISNAYAEDVQINYHSENTIILDDSLKAKVSIDNSRFSVKEFLQQLAQIQQAGTYDYQPSTAALHTALNLSVHLVANGAIVPQVVQMPDKEYAVRWLPAMLSKTVKSLVDELDSMLPPDIFIWEEANRSRKITSNRAVNLLALFISELVNLASHQVNDDLFESLFFKSTSYAFAKPGENALPGGMMTWLQKFYLSQDKYKPILFVEELPNDSFAIKINVQDTSDSMGASIPLLDVLTKSDFNSSRFEILQSVSQLSGFIDGLDDFINSAGEREVVMPNSTFAPFLMQIIPAIQLLDIQVMLPKSLQEVLRPQASVKLKRKAETGGKSFLRLDKLLDFEWQVAIGNSLLSEEEFRNLLLKSEGLIKFKTEYFYVDQSDMLKLHKHFAQTKEMSAFQMLRTALSGDYNGASVGITDEVKELINELNDFSKIELPENLNATLRPYQERGFSWIYRNAQIGFGSILADDMGLGKTLQVITSILKFKADGVLDKKKVLVVSPTGLITNWEAEIQKFAPSLKTSIYHGTSRSLDANNDYDVLLTSYGMVRSDAELLKKHKWHSVVIDEAQNIKNQNTAQTKAIKSMKSENFIALSGTPVENRLSELWSIMDYSNRGLLGSAKEFADTFGSPIENQNDFAVAEKLKKVTSPFLMRRLKSDKSIISDLPEKIEIDTFGTLSKEQTVLYEKTLEKAMDEIEGVSKTDSKSLFVRQGLVLQMILALKQICNHPAQFLKNGKTDAALSGKVELLFDKLDSIVASNEKVLIFTQFTEMGKLLEQFITERYNNKPLYYHGGCTINQRKEMVERFQTNHADKIFILSLKAAGTGLNLTAANHVIHFDLWWNPAVEAQATDRAYRIGQKRNVMVHRFITKNTFEEKINEMIQSKKALADMTVATGENWIGNLSNKELHEIFDR